MITIEFPLTLPSLANARMHWGARAREVKRQRDATDLVLRASHIIECVEKELAASQWPALASDFQIVIVATITRCSARKLDGDNLQGAAKATRDSIAAYFGVDDGDERIEWRYAQEKAASSSVRLCFVVEKKSPTERGETLAVRRSLPAKKPSDAAGGNFKPRRGVVSSTVRNREAK